MPRKRHKKLTSVDKVNPLKTRSKLTPPTNNERVGKAALIVSSESGGPTNGARTVRPTQQLGTSDTPEQLFY